MLFSILIGAIATLYFLGKACILKLKFFFAGKRGTEGAVAASRHSCVVYNEGAQYWNVFKPVLDAFEERGSDVTYLTSVKDDPVFQLDYRHVQAEYIGDGNIAYAKLNMLNADVVLMTTPGLGVYQLKRSKNVRHYAHVLHMPNDATTYKMFGLDYFDSVLLTGDYQKKDIRELEVKRGLNQKELVVVGCTYLDVLAQKIAQVKTEENKPFTVLVSPSWGASALLSRYGDRLLDPLVKTGWNIIVRPHPQSKKSESDMLKKLADRYTSYSNLEWDYERDNIYSLAKADIMISDFSGIVFDYTFLCDKPVLYVTADFDARPYDAGDLVHPLWQFEVLKKMGIELKEEQFADIAAVIKGAADSPELAAERKIAKETAWMHRGQAGKNIADFMESVVSRSVSGAE